MFKTLDAENFVIFASKYYSNPQCHNAKEFYDDLKRLQYLKKLINRFLDYEKEDNPDKVFRLILNHVIIFYNVFEIHAAHKMIRFKFEDEQLTVLKVCLIFLGLITQKDFINIPLNKNAVKECRKI